MADPIRPDDVFSPDGTVLRRYGPILLEGALALPNLAKLLVRLIRDSRVPIRSKALMVGTLGYLITPLDLIPDIPVIGQTDDLLLIAYSLNHLIKAAGRDVIVEHWDGSQDVLTLIENLVGLGTNLMPSRVRKVLDRFASADR